MNGNFKGICVNIFPKNTFRAAQLFNSDPEWHRPKHMISFFCCFLAMKSRPTVCDPMGCSVPGFPVLHYLPEFAQTHVHWVSNWCHPTISSSAAPFSSCPQSFPAGSFPVSLFFTSGGQNTGASASASFLPVNIQGIPLGYSGIFL